MQRLRQWIGSHPRAFVGFILGGGLLLALVGLVIHLRHEAGLDHARKSLANLQQAHDQMQWLAADPDGPAIHYRLARQIAEEALEPYEFAREGWLERGTITELPAEQAIHARSLATGILFLQAEAIGRLAQWEPDKAARMALVDEGLQLVERASAAWPEEGSLRPLVAQRSWLLKLGGLGLATRDASRQLALSSEPPGAFWQVIPLLREGRPEEAADQSTRPTPQPQSAGGWMLSGICQLRAGRPQLAADAFQAATALQPDLSWARYYRAIALEQCDRLSDASREWDQFLQATPDVAEAWLHRSTVRWRLQDVAGAWDDLKEAERREASPVRVHTQREALATSQGRTKEAELERELVRSSKPRDPGDWTIRGLALLEGHPVDARAALADFEQALTLAPRDLSAGSGKARCLYEHLQQPREGISLLRQLLEVHPDATEERARLASWLASTGSREEARAQALACVTGDASPAGLETALRVLARLAQTPEEITAAIEVAARLLRADPPRVLKLAREPDLGGIRVDIRFQCLEQSARVLAGN